VDITFENPRTDTTMYMRCCRAVAGKWTPMWWRYT
jgi:hypothetical protein